MLKDDLFQAGNVKTEPVKVGGIKLYVRQLTYGARLEMEKTVLAKGPDSLDLRTQAILLCTCDENGDAVFTKEDLPNIMNMRADMIDALFQEIDKVNGFTEKN
ncbi:MAG: phage tail assembly chaperone family protein, TAC [Pseudomonadota bacterium]